jgi:hypothetical protein
MCVAEEIKFIMLLYHGKPEMHISPPPAFCSPSHPSAISSDQRTPIEQPRLNVAATLSRASSTIPIDF